MALYPSIPTTSESDTFVKGRASYVFEASPRLWVWLHFLNSTRLGKISLYLLEATCQVPEPLTSIWDLKFPVYHINLIRLAKAEMPPLSLSSILLHDPELAKFSRKNAWHHQPIAEGAPLRNINPSFTCYFFVSLLSSKVFFFFCMFDSCSYRQNTELQKTTVFYPKVVESDLSALQIWTHRSPT